MRNKKIQILCTVLVVVFISITVYRNSLPDCRNKTKEFLDWFNDDKTNYRYLVVDQNNNYKIDLKSTNQYIEYLKTTGLFSNEFLQDILNYIEKGYRFYEYKNRPADDIPTGFNGSVIFFSQSLPRYFYQDNKDEFDPSYKLKIEKIDGNGQNIMVDDNFRFEFDKECMILNIDSFGAGGIKNSYFRDDGKEF
jgi:hypothetical protein